MLLNIKDEQNIILSFKKDISKPGISKEKLSSEIHNFLQTYSFSEETAAILKGILQKINQMIPSNENHKLSY